MDEYELNICVTYQHVNIKDIARTLAGTITNLGDAFTFRIIAVNLSILIIYALRELPAFCVCTRCVSFCYTPSCIIAPKKDLK